jgi:type IV pilus assembly protein PilA
MFQRFHAMKERKEEGFTLIELLVVILIIAILAAIAIPVFLNQRKKGWVAQQESALKNAATNMESYSTGNQGTYPHTVALLEAEGFNQVAAAPVTIIYPTAVTPQDGHYCLKSTHTQSVPAMYYSSVTGVPSTTACT